MLNIDQREGFTARLVLIETSGNQRYIFATNKLRENVGASESTYRAGTAFVLAAVSKIVGLTDLFHEDSNRFRNNLLNEQLNPKIEDQQYPAEVILATSGKALLVVKDENIGRQIIKEVTQKAVLDAPGLEIYGAISREFIFGKENFNDLVREVHEEYERVRANLPSAEQRFLRIPMVQECATSGLPANYLFEIGKESKARSIVSIEKLRAAEQGYQRMCLIVEQQYPEIKLAKSIEVLEEKFTNLEWLSVIHADGNGLGKIFLNFQKYAQKDSNLTGLAVTRDYINKLRWFSLALDICTENAFCTALKKLHDKLDNKNSGSRSIVPVVPLVIGGDDLTILCDGRFALKFISDFLAAFEEETTRKDEKYLSGIIATIAQAAFEVNRLSSCAGIAIVKPHYPFYNAYSLAEELLRSAKEIKQHIAEPCSALDFHIVFDTTAVSLEDIRQQLHQDNNSTLLYARPYIVTPTILAQQKQEWINQRSWPKLSAQVAVINARDVLDNNRRKLPNSLLHDLRESLFSGKAVADARFQLVCKRYERDGLQQLAGDSSGNSLFWTEGNCSVSSFLDALMVSEFWL